MALPWLRVNQRASSGPAVMNDGMPPSTGTSNAVNAPSAPIRPIFPASIWVNHIAPSGPAVMPYGVVASWTVSCPSVVMRLMRPPLYSVNHIAPPGPGVITVGRPSAGSSRWITGSSPGTSLPTQPWWASVNQMAPSAAVAMPYGAPASIMVNMDAPDGGGRSR
ncbi:hypothetical protein ACFQ0B_25635 [Nonomuraea thailandensis]